MLMLLSPLHCALCSSFGLHHHHPPPPKLQAALKVHLTPAENTHCCSLHLLHSFGLITVKAQSFSHTLSLFLPLPCLWTTPRQGFWFRLTRFLSFLWYTSVKTVYDCVIVVLLSSLVTFPTSCFSKVSVSHFEVPQRSNRERTRAPISSILKYICSGLAFIHIVHRQFPQSAQSTKFATVPF